MTQEEFRRIVAGTEARLRADGCTCAVDVKVHAYPTGTKVYVKHEPTCVLHLRKSARWN